MTEANHNTALERMRATGKWGDMPSCPSCGNGNAVLHYMAHELPHGAPTEYACRDCRYPLTQDELEHQRQLVFERTVKLYWPELLDDGGKALAEAESQTADGLYEQRALEAWNQS